MKGLEPPVVHSSPFITDLKSPLSSTVLDYAFPRAKHTEHSLYSPVKRLRNLIQGYEVTNDIP